MSIPRRAGRNIFITGLGLSALSLLAYLTTSSAIGAVLDLRRSGAALGLVALVLVLLGMFTSSANGHPRRQLAAGLAGSVFVLVVCGLFLKLLFLTYHEEEVRFRNGPIVLAGTLYAPKGEGPFPAVIIVHGAGSGLRAQYGFYARLFASHGIIGLAYDKRGTGASTGKRWEADYEALSRDTLAGLRFLQARKEVDSGRVGLMGISEGEWVGLLAAAAAGDAKFFVAVSPSGRSPADQVLYEVEAELKHQRIADASISQALSLNRRLFDFVRTGKGREQLEADLKAAEREPWYAAAKLPRDLGSSEDWAWWRSVMDFDPLPVWSRITCPALLVSGALDRKSPVEDSQDRIRRALMSAGNTSVTARIFPSAGHGVVEWWLPGHLPPPRFAPGYLNLLLNWVAAQH